MSSKLQVLHMGAHFDGFNRFLFRQRRSPLSCKTYWCPGRNSGRDLARDVAPAGTHEHIQILSIRGIGLIVTICG